MEKDKNTAGSEGGRRIDFKFYFKFVGFLVRCMFHAFQSLKCICVQVVYQETITIKITT